MPVYWKQILNLIQKDLTSELRAKESVNAMLIFGLTIIVVFSFAFNLGSREQVALAPGLLWIAFTFSGILGLNHSFDKENENGCMNGLLLTPIPRSVIYVGKFISNFLFMFFAEMVILLFFVWLFDVRFTGNWHLLILTIILGTSGFCATGTIFSALSTGSRMKVFLLPLLQFPIVIPVMIASVEATAVLLNEESIIGFYDWINLLLVFNIIFITVSVLLFEFIMEE